MDPLSHVSLCMPVDAQFQLLTVYFEVYCIYTPCVGQPSSVDKQFKTVEGTIMLTPSPSLRVPRNTTRAFKKSKRDIMARLGFDVLAHLEAMRDKGVRSINIDDATQASPAALRAWEDTNYPYRQGAASSFALAVSFRACMLSLFRVPCERLQTVALYQRQQTTDSVCTSTTSLIIIELQRRL